MKHTMNLNIEIEGNLAQALVVAGQLARHIEKSSDGKDVVLGVNVYKSYEPATALDVPQQTG